jgi:hypothetical protein
MIPDPVYLFLWCRKLTLALHKLMLHTLPRCSRKAAQPDLRGSLRPDICTILVRALSACHDDPTASVRLTHSIRLLMAVTSTRVKRILFCGYDT